MKPVAPALLSHKLTDDRLSNVLCWSRIQSEAGQGLDYILIRKEHERVAGEGLFWWGVGTAPGPAARALARTQCQLDIIFSVMKSQPKQADVAPRGLLIWRRFVDSDGNERDLPRHVLVTSRAETRLGAKLAHYALVCWSEEPLRLTDQGPFDPSAYRNLGGTGAPIGASQVTALVRRVSAESRTCAYRINMKARLAEALWVKLADPVPVCDTKRALMDRWLSPPVALSASDWRELVAQFREGPEQQFIEPQRRLF
jgi:hypothetical protein